MKIKYDIKKCPHCYKEVVGHPNKKFCNSKCKDDYHNNKRLDRMKFTYSGDNHGNYDGDEWGSK